MKPILTIIVVAILSGCASKPDDKPVTTNPVNSTRFGGEALYDIPKNQADWSNGDHHHPGLLTDTNELWMVEYESKALCICKRCGNVIKVGSAGPGSYANFPYYNSIWTNPEKWGLKVPATATNKLGDTEL